MAVTINTSPSGTPSVNDNLWHVCTSDNSGSPDMKYVYDVYVGGEQLVRVKQFPEPSNGKSYFDAGPIVRNEFSYDWFEPINSSVYVAEPDMSGQIGVVYNLRVGEEVSGITTLNMASGDVSAFNWAPNLFKRRVDGLSTRLNKWATNRPFNLETALGEKICVTKAELGENIFIGSYTDEAPTLQLQKFDANNNSIGTVISGVNLNLENGFLQCNIGTTALSATLSTTFDASVKYYDAWFVVASNPTTYKVRVYLTCNPKYTNIPIHFLNRWGMWDSHRFDLVSKLSMDVERKNFTGRDYQFNGNSVDYLSANNVYYGGKTNYSNVANWTYKLNSDALSDGEWVWLADLIQSPQILMELDGYFYPVTIKKNNYDYNQYVVDRLKPLEIEFELNTNRNTQLR
jgi:hypothetical protein